MAAQPEVGTYDAGVYQIETTDPVLGGRGGVANAPLLNLANRTGWLFGEVNTINGEIPLLAPKANPVFTGSIDFTAAEGASAPFFFQSAGVARWAIETDGATETGNNTGSNLQIGRYTDAGQLIDFPLILNRATGVLSSAQTTAFNTSGNAATATALANARTIAASGDAAWSVSFDGSDNVTGALTIQENAVSNDKLAEMPAMTFKANLTNVLANAADATVAAVIAALGFVNATAAQIRAGIDNVGWTTSKGLADSGNWLGLTDAATTAWPMDQGFNAKWSIGATGRVLGIPSGCILGRPITLIVYKLSSAYSDPVIPSCFFFGAQGTPSFSNSPVGDMITGIVESLSPLQIRCGFNPGS